MEWKAAGTPRVWYLMPKLNQVRKISETGITQTKFNAGELFIYEEEIRGKKP